MQDTIENQKKDVEKGATMLEYALMAALIAIVCIAAVTLLGQQACRAFSGSASAIATGGSLLN